MAPAFLKKYFWDINFEKSDPKKHREYFLKRILELGDKKAFLWAKRTFGLTKIREFVNKKKLSPKSQNFWQNV